MARVRFDAKKKKYVADVRDLVGNAAGNQRQFRTEGEAIEHVRAVTAAQKQFGVFIDPQDTPLVGAAQMKWSDEQQHAAKRGEHQFKSARSKELAMKNVAEIFCGFKKLKNYHVGEIRPSMMRDVCIAFAATVNKQATFRRKWGYCVQFFDWCVEADWITENPAKFSRGAGMRLPMVPKAEDEPLSRVSKEIIYAITEAASEDVRLAIKVAWGTGIRQGEQRALQWGPDGLDTTAGILHVTRAYDGDHKIGGPKTKLGRRTVPIAPGLLSELRAWRVAQPTEQRKNNFVFPSPTGEIANPDSWRRGLHRACERAGVGVIRWHDLRHYFASIILFDNSFNEATVTQLLGHHSISFTKNVYGHWMDDVKRDAGLAEALGRALR